MKTYNMGPGSGKTTTALETIHEIIQENVPCTYLTITNNAVNDASERFFAAHPELSKESTKDLVKFSTMHSYALELLRVHFATQGIELLPVVRKKDSPIRLGPLENLWDRDNEVREHARELVIQTFSEYLNTLPSPKKAVIYTDYCMHLYAALNLKPKDKHVLIIDEYQDMNLYEVYTLASSFGDNAILFGDKNQFVYGFRFKNPSDFSIVTPANDDSMVTSYRLKADTCDLTNRWLQFKRSVTGPNWTPMTRLTSHHEQQKNEKGKPIGSFGYEIIEDRSNDRIAKEAYMTSHVERLAKRLPEKPDLLVLTTDNSLAVSWSMAMIKQYGDSNVSSRYMPAAFHPVYRMIKYYARSSDLSFRDRTQNARSIVLGMVKSLRAIGMTPKASIKRHSLITAADNDSETKSKYESTPVGIFLNKLNMAITGSGKVPPEFCMGKGTYTPESEKRALTTLVSMLAEKGLRAVRSGLRYDLAHPTGDIRILTIHSAKGLEADHVILDLSGGWLLEAKSEAIVQFMNLIYVGISRHKEKLHIIMPERFVKQRKMFSPDEFVDAYIGLCSMTRGVENPLTGQEMRSVGVTVPAQYNSEDDTSKRYKVAPPEIREILFSALNQCASKSQFAGPLTTLMRTARQEFKDF